MQTTLLFKTVIGGLMGGALLFVPIFSFTHAQTSTVRINEIAWMGTTTSTSDEWIELYNTSTISTDLSGWTLSAADGTPSISLEGVIQPNQFFLLERTNDESVPSQIADQIYAGALGNSGEQLHLINAAGTVVDSIDNSSGWLFGDNATKQTLERADISTWQTSNNPEGTPKEPNSHSAPPPPPDPMPGPPNDPEPIQLINEPTSPPQPPSSDSIQEESYPEGILINEILPSPEGPDNEGEWIEIYNSTSQTINLSGWMLEDLNGVTKQFIFPEGSQIGANGFLVLSRLTTSITLNNDSDGVTLFAPNNNLMDTVSYSSIQTGSSYARLGDEWVITPTPTPGSTNIAPPPTNTSITKENSSLPEPQSTTKIEDPDSPDKEQPQTLLANPLQTATSQTSSSNTIIAGIIAIVLISFGGAWFITKKSPLSSKEEERYY